MRTDEDLRVIEQMAKRGGSFVKSLAEAFRTADHLNFEKLKRTFSDYWFDYEQMAKREA